MRAVVYHYVRCFDQQLPLFRYLDIVNFRKQLDYFDKSYGFVTKEEWLDFVTKGKMPKKTG